jgi:hypothetical protein
MQHGWRAIPLIGLAHLTACRVLILIESSICIKPLKNLLFYPIFHRA